MLKMCLELHQLPRKKKYNNLSNLNNLQAQDREITNYDLTFLVVYKICKGSSRMIFINGN